MENLTDKQILSLINSVRTKIKSSINHSLILPPRTDSAFILKFLHVKKFHVEDTFNRIQKYYTEINHNLDLHKGIKFNDYKYPIINHTITILKHRIENCATMHINYANWDINQFSFQEFQIAALFLIEELVNIEVNQKNGMCILVDLEGLSFKHLKIMSVGEVKKAICMMLMGLPARVNSIHAVNFPRILWPVFTMAMKLLPSKLRSRFHIHENLCSLHKLTKKEELPRSLGGDLEEDEAVDTEFIRGISERNPGFEDYWSNRNNDEERVRKMSRKRSRVMVMGDEFKIAKIEQ